MSVLVRLLGIVGLGGISPMFLLAGAIGLVTVVGGAYLYVDHQGYARAEAKCEAAALRARVAELQTQVKNANDRADEAGRVIAELQQKDVAAAEREDALRREVATAKLQSTKPGAKIDATAILDDQCLLTDRGARRLRGR